MNSETKSKLRLSLLFCPSFILFPILLLVVSAALKTHVLLAVPSREFFVGGSFPLTLVVVWLEFLLAAWLASRWQPKLAGLLALVVFSVFAVVSTFKLSQGVANCGCFGAFQTSPWLSLTLDLAAIACLVISYSVPENCDRTWASVVLGLAILICLVQGALVIKFSPRLSSGDIVFDGYGGIAFLEPDKWLEKELPLLPWLENSEQLREGRWTVFLLISQCELCHKVLATMPENLKDTRIAIVEFPPYPESTTEVSTAAVYFQVDAHRNWFVTAPVRLEIFDGIVTSVTNREEIKTSLGR